MFYPILMSHHQLQWTQTLLAILGGCCCCCCCCCSCSCCCCCCCCCCEVFLLFGEVHMVGWVLKCCDKPHILMRFLFHFTLSTFWGKTVPNLLVKLLEFRKKLFFVLGGKNKQQTTFINTFPPSALGGNQRFVFLSFIWKVWKVNLRNFLRCTQLLISPRD